MPATARANATGTVPQNMTNPANWLDDFMALTQDLVSPEIFRVWTGITMIAGALERRVWTRTSSGEIFPNLFTTLVAPPGIGKSTIIDFAEKTMLKAKKFKLAPKDVTRSSLIDALSKAAVKRPLTATNLLEYNSLFVTASELGVFLPAYDTGFLSLLNYIYDNPPSYTQERRSNNLEIDIKRPQMTILAGTQPGFLASLLPEEAWSMGTTSRLIMIYAAQGPKPNFWNDRAALDEDKAYARLVQRLRELSDLYGEMQWLPCARKAMWTWYMDEDCAPVPTHSRLQHYLPRRHLHVFKLAMIASAMRGNSLEVCEADFVTARDWLLWAEQLMPDIFRDMGGKSDTQVIQELHFFLWSIFAKDKKPIHESKLISFLSTRVPSEKVLKVIEIAERSNVLARSAGTPYYTPIARHLHGQE